MPAPASRTLRSAADFRRVFREGKTVSTPEVVVHAARRPDGGPGRYGLVVSRKFGNAVARNRARRQLREAVALAGGIPAGVDSVIIARPGARLIVSELSREICKIMYGQAGETSSGAIRNGR